MADVEKAEVVQAQQTSPHAGALRAFLVGAARVRPEVITMVKSLEGLFTALHKDKLLVVKRFKPTVIHVAALGATVKVRGMARRQGTNVVPCLVFYVGDREVPVKMVVAPAHTAWTWVENAGLGVAGQPVDAETTCRVFLALLAGEV